MYPSAHKILKVNSVLTLFGDPGQYGRIVVCPVGLEHLLEPEPLLVATAQIRLILKTRIVTLILVPGGLSGQNIQLAV